MTRLFDEIIGQETVSYYAKPVPVPVAFNFVISALVLDTPVTVHQAPAVFHSDSPETVLFQKLVQFHTLPLVIAS